MAEALAARLPEAELVVDPEPDGVRNPWRTYREALDSTPAWATHRVIVQDDVTLCRRFGEALEAAVGAQPDRVIVLFHGGQPREDLIYLDRGIAAGRPLVELRSRRWVPVVANVYPARVVCPIVCWTVEQDWPQLFRADDEVIGRALRALNEPVLAAAPSLVQHEDVVPSLIGRRARAGEDPARVAHRFCGDADPMLLDWSAPPVQW